MTSFLWTYTDLANVRLLYQYGDIKHYDEFRTRLAEMRASNASTVSVPNSSDGGNGDRRVSDLDVVGVDGVSGELINKAQLPHRATRSSSGLKERGA